MRGGGGLARVRIGAVSVQGKRRGHCLEERVSTRARTPRHARTHPSAGGARARRRSAPAPPAPRNARSAAGRTRTPGRRPRRRAWSPAGPTWRREGGAVRADGRGAPPRDDCDCVCLSVCQEVWRRVPAPGRGGAGRGLGREARSCVLRRRWRARARCRVQCWAAFYFFSLRRCRRLGVGSSLFCRRLFAAFSFI